MISAGFTIALSRLTPLETLPAPCKMPLEKLSLSLLAMQWIFPGFCPQCRGLLQNSGKQTNLLQFPAGKSALPAGNSREGASVLSCVHRATTAGVDKISEPSCSSEKGPQTLPRLILFAVCSVKVMQGWESLWIHLWGWFSSKPGSAFVKSPHFQSCCVGRRNTQLPVPIVKLALKIKNCRKTTNRSVSRAAPAC